MSGLRFLKLPILAMVAMLTMAASAAFASSGPHSEHSPPGHEMGMEMPGMTHTENGMSHGQNATHGMPHGGHDIEDMSDGGHGMVHGDDAAHMDEHSAASGHDAGHGAPPVASKRPVKLMLTGFALFNVFILAAAAFLRRRPAAIKRRETLERVRHAGGAPKSDLSEEDGA